MNPVSLFSLGNREKERNKEVLKEDKYSKEFKVSYNISKCMWKSIMSGAIHGLRNNFKQKVKPITLLLF
jgi:hypothetical protein